MNAHVKSTIKPHQVHITHPSYHVGGRPQGWIHPQSYSLLTNTGTIHRFTLHQPSFCFFNCCDLFPCVFVIQDLATTRHPLV